MSRLFWQNQAAVLFLALATGWGTWLFSGWSQKALPRKADNPTESVIFSGGQTTPTKGTTVTADTTSLGHVWDHSAIHNGLLLARSISPGGKNSSVGLGTVGDLWLQSSNGQQRFIAEAVVCAKFSPD